MSCPVLAEGFGGLAILPYLIAFVVVYCVLTVVLGVALWRGRVPKKLLLYLDDSGTPRHHDPVLAARKPDHPPAFAVGDRVHVIDDYSVVGLRSAVGTVVERPHYVRPQQGFVWVEFDEFHADPNGEPCAGGGFNAVNLRSEKT